MFSRTSLLAAAMLGLGTLAGYGAARHGPVSPPPAVAAAPVACATTTVDGMNCCVEPTRAAMLTSFQDKGYQTPKPGNPRGATTGPTDAPGYDHPNQYLVTKPTQIAENMEPVIVHPSQVKEATEKLAKAAAKFGKKPNFLIFLMDDVGWMDPGFNGGGVTVGNPTPNMDKIASQGLVLTSAYSTPSCSPSRASIMTAQNTLITASCGRRCITSRAAWMAW